MCVCITEVSASSLNYLPLEVCSHICRDAVYAFFFLLHEGSQTLGSVCLQPSANICARCVSSLYYWMNVQQAGNTIIHFIPPLQLCKRKNWNTKRKTVGQTVFDMQLSAVQYYGNFLQGCFKVWIAFFMLQKVTALYHRK